jgi:hypothetical protein
VPVPSVADVAPEGKPAPGRKQNIAKKQTIALWWSDQKTLPEPSH